MRRFITGIAVLGLAYAAGAVSYLDLMEIAVAAYDDARIEAYVREVETQGVQEHGFPRLAANLAVLVAEGRQTARTALLARMLDLACAGAKKGKMPPKSGGNEFSVRELVAAVQALEASGTFPPARLAAWKADLKAVDARRCYRWSDLSRLGEAEGHNWPLFGAASEQARLQCGLGGDPAYIEAWVADQLRHFDAQGMYRDPHEPAVYDFIGRLCYMALLHAGYDGPCRAPVERVLEKSAEPTLAMLSVCGEIPYGGRSNQFLHNHTMYAAVAEWYAGFFARRGDAARAARFRAAADEAVAALEPWLAAKPLHHVKNLYPPPAAAARNTEQRWFGCEDYAYFDKYMVTMASWAALARTFRNAAPADLPSVRLDRAPEFRTSECFHWKFVHGADYTVQEDWNANPQYDATGVGRIHRRGAPAAICLSAPCARKPNYFIGAQPNPGPLAIAGWRTYAVTDAGMLFTCAAGATLTLPAFAYDGREETRLETTPACVTVRYRGWTCRYTVTGGRFTDTGLVYHNRNGRYRRIDATGDGPFTVRVEIVKG